MQANLTEMKQVLLNLTINALEAVPPGDGEVRIERPADWSDWVELSVKDNGRGMCAGVAAARLRAVLHRHAGKPASPGTGLGLSITHAIVESHGGRIQAESDGPAAAPASPSACPRHAANRRVTAATT